MEIYILLMEVFLKDLFLQRKRKKKLKICIEESDFTSSIPANLREKVVRFPSTIDHFQLL